MSELLSHTICTTPVRRVADALARDNIAAMVLQGLAASDPDCSPKVAASRAVDWADALLERLQK